MKQKPKLTPSSIDDHVQFLPDVEFTEISYDSLSFDEYDIKPFNFWMDRIVAFSTGIILGAGMADIYPEYIPDSVLGQVGAAIATEQVVNVVQILNHHVRPDGRTWTQRLKRSFRDDPYRIAGIYVGQLAIRTLMY